MVAAAVEKEREAFLLPIKIRLAVIGVFVLVPRVLSNAHFQGDFATFMLGWPTLVIWLVAGAMCAYVLSHLFNRRSKKFLATLVSLQTLTALEAALPAPEGARLENLRRAMPVRVADLIALQASEAAPAPGAPEISK